MNAGDGGRDLQGGPYAETKEDQGGYDVIEAPDLDGALDWAAKNRAATTGAVEVRPVVTPSARRRHGRPRRSRAAMMATAHLPDTLGRTTEAGSAFDRAADLADPAVRAWLLERQRGDPPHPQTSRP